MNIIAFQDDVGIEFQFVDQKWVGLKYYVKMPKSLKLDVEEIKLIETIFNPLVDIDGPICEE
jgi:ABC-type polysaccharide transport system permease subunit